MKAEYADYMSFGASFSVIFGTHVGIEHISEHISMRIHNHHSPDEGAVENDVFAHQ